MWLVPRSILACKEICQASLGMNLGQDILASGFSSIYSLWNVALAQFKLSTFQQKILLNTFWPSKNKQNNSHTLYMWYGSLDLILISVTSSAYCLVLTHFYEIGPMVLMETQSEFSSEIFPAWNNGLHKSTCSIFYPVWSWHEQKLTLSYCGQV